MTRCSSTVTGYIVRQKFTPKVSVIPAPSVAFLSSGRRNLRCGYHINLETEWLRSFVEEPCSCGGGAALTMTITERRDRSKRFPFLPFLDPGSYFL